MKGLQSNEFVALGVQSKYRTRNESDADADATVMVTINVVTRLSLCRIVDLLGNRDENR